MGNKAEQLKTLVPCAICKKGYPVNKMFPVTHDDEYGNIDEEAGEKYTEYYACKVCIEKCPEV